jgi:hypothetical protein
MAGDKRSPAHGLLWRSFYANWNATPRTPISSINPYLTAADIRVVVEHAYRNEVRL